MSSINSEPPQLEFAPFSSPADSPNPPSPDTLIHNGTRSKKRSSYFTALEQKVLLQSYDEYAYIFSEKSNTAVAAKARQDAWKKIAARVNACNSSGEKRTWIQLKMKYKNIIQKGNRKRAEARKAAARLLPSLTEADILSQNCHRSEGVIGRSLSEPLSPQDPFVRDGIVYVVESPSTVTVGNHTVEENIQLSAVSERDTETHTEASQIRDEGTSLSNSQLDMLPVKDLYRQHLIRNIEKTDKEIIYLDHKIRKADLEIQLLERQLRMDPNSPPWSQ